MIEPRETAAFMLEMGLPRLVRGGSLGFLLTFSILATFAFTGCDPKPKALVDAQALPPNVIRGRSIYQTQCIACHNSDPHRPGSIGPEVFGSSKELLEARILKAEYPPGYKPKRGTHAMAALPHLKNEIDAIHEYLNFMPGK